MGYDDSGDGTKTPPNAPHCLLLWRKPPLRILAEAFFKGRLNVEGELMLIDCLFLRDRDRFRDDRNDNKE
jgi:hypothetical protein